MEKDLDYYLNLDWTIIEGQDLDFDGKPYHYIEIKEIPSFTFCAKTIEKARENYKTQLKMVLMVMLEEGDRISEPGGKCDSMVVEETQSIHKSEEDDTDWESLCP